MNKENKIPFLDPTPSNDGINGEPIDDWDLINKYGTYEVQDTADTDNTFPMIAQGLSGPVEAYLPDVETYRHKKKEEPLP